MSTNKILAKVQCCISKPDPKSDDFDCLGLHVKAFTEAMTNIDKNYRDIRAYRIFE
jgi:hypothetical protein